MTRPAALALVVVALTLLGLIAVGMLSMLTGSTPTAPASPSLCLPATAPDAAPADPASLNGEQRGIAARIIGLGKTRQLPPRAWQVALQAGKTESNLANLPYGDRDSLGIFQMRPSMGWGTAEQLSDVDYQIHKFYEVLLTVPDWEQIRPGEAAQKVERSGYPGRYHQAEPLAAALIHTLGGITDVAGCADLPAPTESAHRAMEFARAHLGDGYAWGATGPDMWDCSSFVQAAWRAADIALPRISPEQYAAGTHVPLTQAQPGDLVFWGYGRDPSAIHHVALYLAPGQVLHAPEPGDVVKISDIWDSDELLPTVTRPTHSM